MSLLCDFDALYFDRLRITGIAKKNSIGQISVDMYKACQAFPLLVPKDTVINVIWLYQNTLNGITDFENSVIIDLREYLFCTQNSVEMGNYHFSKAIFHTAAVFKTVENPYGEAWDEYPEYSGYYIAIHNEKENLNPPAVYIISSN